MKSKTELNTTDNNYKGFNPNELRDFVKSKEKYVDPLQHVTPYDYIKSIKKNRIKHIFETIKLKFQNRKIYMVVMQLKTGKYIIMNIATTKDYFIFDRGAYHIDADMCDYETSSRMNMLFYHQGCSLPIKLDFNMDELRESLKENSSDVEKAVNPNSLRAFINSQVIEKVLQGAELLKDLNQVKLLIIINTIISVGVVLILAKTLGWI